MGESRAFSLLAPGLQRWLWEQGWTELREIQEAAAEPILRGRDVVIASPTASGKTEAAFLPIFSQITREDSPGLHALSISPLKALINDQQRRLESMAEAAETTVTPWHGDIAASRKRRLRENPQGVLLITPESLEALFVNRGTTIPVFFAALRYVVIDELHAFIGTERGRQLQSLLHRLEAAIERRVPRIGLSATLGDLALAAEYLRPGNGDRVEIIETTAFAREIRLQIRGFCRQHLPEQLEDQDTAPTVPAAPAGGLGDEHSVAADLYRFVEHGTHLVFANSRANVERYTDLLVRNAARTKALTVVHPHHGSLSKELREDAEAALKSTRDAIVIATTTLELGIDVGEVDTIAQIGVPPSVSALWQRLGRSGRDEGTPSVIRIFIQEDEILPNTPVLDQLRPSLVEAVAMVRLLAERWVEPPLPGALHLSTAVQQILSVIAQTGGLSAQRAYRVLCETGPFSSIGPTRFAHLLRDLGHHDLISQTHDGTLVLGLTGERLVGFFDFYASFSTPEEWRLIANGRELGTLPVSSPIAVDSFLIFGGKRWRIVAIEDVRRTIELERAPGGIPPVWTGEGALVHGRVREEMRRVYLEADTPAFLNEQAKALLDEGRQTFRRLGLAERAIVRDGHDAIILPWVSDRVLDTIALALRDRGVEVNREGCGLAAFYRTPDEMRALFARMAASPPPDPLAIAGQIENLRTQKHHRFLSYPLLLADFASSRLDVPAAWESIARLASDPL